MKTEVGCGKKFKEEFVDGIFDIFICIQGRLCPNCSSKARMKLFEAYNPLTILDRKIKAKYKEVVEESINKALKAQFKKLEHTWREYHCEKLNQKKKEERELLNTVLTYIEELEYGKAKAILKREISIRLK